MKKSIKVNESKISNCYNYKWLFHCACKLMCEVYCVQAYQKENYIIFIWFLDLYGHLNDFCFRIQMISLSVSKWYFRIPFPYPIYWKYHVHITTISSLTFFFYYYSTIIFLLIRGTLLIALEHKFELEQQQQQHKHRGRRLYIPY